MSGSFLEFMALKFPGLTPAPAIFLTISLVVVAAFCLFTGIYLVVRHLRRSPVLVIAPAPSETTSASSRPSITQAAPAMTTNVSDNLHVTPDIDLEAGTGAKVNGLTEQDTMTVMTDSVREAYSKLIGEYKAPTPAEPMFPDGPRPKCRELKDDVCEDGCFCKSILGQIAGYGRNSSPVGNIDIGTGVFGSSSRVHPRLQYAYMSQTNTSRFSSTSDSTSSSSEDYISVPVIPLSRPVSQSSYGSTADSRVSTGSVAFHAPILNTPSLPLVTRPISIACYDAVPNQRQERASVPVGMKPLILVQKVNNNQGNPALFPPTTNEQRKTVVLHDTTVSRIVKIGRGRRHRDARPATLGY